jgi:O-methyltransferase involved in polyketide biosynthesis
MELDTTRPHPARMWNYWLGGEDNFEIDREVGEQLAAAFPAIREVARHSRACLGRMVRHLAGQEGVRQFLDVGTGLPTRDNTHEIAQRVAPDCRVVSVDNDPMVLAHAEALLAGASQGRTSYLDRDVRDPDGIIAAARETLDFSRPVALILFGVMGNVIDDDEAAGIVRRLVGALPPGSFVALNDGTGETDRAGREAAIRLAVEKGSPPYAARTPGELAAFFDGLELLDPGVVTTSRWRPDPSEPLPPPVDSSCGLARKP